VEQLHFPIRLQLNIWLSLVEEEVLEVVLILLMVVVEEVVGCLRQPI
jgi:hypothetical protein